ncbi:MAG: BON domain-containing protein [Pseudomonadota bacterium]
MRLAHKTLTVAVFVAFGLFSLGAAYLAAGMIERVSGSSVKTALLDAGHDWAGVETGGLRVVLTGTAPNEASRLQAMIVAGSIVDATRVIDGMDVVAAAPIAPPRFSVELLRNDDGISLIGLIPAQTDREEMVGRVTQIADGATVNDLLETADHTPPDSWDDAVDMGLDALSRLPRSKISIAAGEVRVKASTEDFELQANSTGRSAGQLGLKPCFLIQIFGAGLHTDRDHAVYIAVHQRSGQWRQSSV